MPSDNSQDDGSKQTIKIAAKSLSKRQQSGAADPGPGDMSAAPSEAPELVEIPRPPTAAELVVKSSNEPSISLKEVESSMGGGGGGGGRSGSKSVGAVASSQGFKSKPERSGGKSSGRKTARRNANGSPDLDSISLSKLPTNYNEKTVIATGAHKSLANEQRATSEAVPASRGGSGAGGSRSKSGHGSAMEDGSWGASSIYKSTCEPKPGDSGATSYKSINAEGATETSPSPGPESPSSGSTHEGGGGSHSGRGRHGKKKKKVTKFRYHKRITVRTHGKTNPTSIMDKVSKRDNLTPSTIEDMDPQELIRRAGIKTAANTHWRVRLRQTKRSTKNGRTVTQTKVAYRDSEGNKRVRSSVDPCCKKCGKKLEECKCDIRSNTDG